MRRGGEEEEVMISHSECLLLERGRWPTVGRSVRRRSRENTVG